MAVNIGPKIGIDGEKEFRAQLKQINEGYKTLASEAKLVASEFAGNEKSMEALEKKSSVLERQIYTLTERLELQERMLKESADAFGEADERTMKWQQAVNETKTQLNGMKTELGQTQTAIENYNEETDDAGEKSFGLADAIGGKLGISSNALTAAGAVAALAVAVKEIGQFFADSVKESAAYADNILTLSTNYGIATEQLQAYQYMAELADTDVNTITGSIARLTKNMDSARNGTGDAAAAFAQLGIRITDSNGHLRDASDVFVEAIDHLGYIQDATERDAIAMNLFGKSAMELNSLIAAGKDGMNAYALEAQNMGYILSTDELNALGAVDDSFKRLNNMMTAIKNQIGAEMAPVLIELAEQLLDIAQAVDWRSFGQAAAQALKKLAPVIIVVAESVAGLAMAFTALMDSISGRSSSSRNQYSRAASTATRNTATSMSSATPQAQAFGSDRNRIGGFGGGDTSTTVNIDFTGDLAQVGRIMQPQITTETQRLGPRAIS